MSDNLKLDVAWSPPLSGFLAEHLSEEGRWFEIPGAGTVWTNDNSVVMFRRDQGSKNQDFSQHVYDEVVSGREYLFGKGVSPDEIFNEMYEEYSEVYLETSPIIEGPLSVLHETLSTEDNPSVDYSYGFTADEEGNLLEFFMQSSEGTWLYDDPSKEPSDLSAWIKIDPEAEEEAYPTFYGVPIYDTTDDGVFAYKKFIREKDGATVEDMKQWIVES